MIGADYRLMFSSPSGCIQPDCLVFAGIDTNSGNPDYLDFYISGQAESWVAVGFSPTRSMVSVTPIRPIFPDFTAYCDVCEVVLVCPLLDSL